MKQIIKILSCLLLCALMLAGCCSHEWEDANCEQPRTCSECGATEGEKGDHDWEKATCEHPKTCTVCGKEKGDLADHKWEDATCDEPETCRNCGETRGEALGHQWAGFICQECGETMEIPAETVATEVIVDEDDGSLGLYPEDFLWYLLDYAEMFSDSYAMGEVLEYTDKWYSCYVNFEEEPAFKVMINLNWDTGRVDDVTVRQLEPDLPDADLISLYTVAIAMGQPNPEKLADVYGRIDEHMTTQDIREDAVYEIYELDGYYIQVWRKGTEGEYLYEVEVFRPTVF